MALEMQVKAKERKILDHEAEIISMEREALGKINMLVKASHLDPKDFEEPVSVVSEEMVKHVEVRTADESL